MNCLKYKSTRNSENSEVAAQNSMKLNGKAQEFSLISVQLCINFN
jgi:hypothetical protein